MLPGAGNRESPVVEQFLDPKEILNVLPFIYAMSGLGLFGCEIRKLRFPKAQNIWLDADDFTYFGYFKKQLVWNCC